MSMDLSYTEITQKPIPHPYYKESRLLLEKRSICTPKVSVVVPVFNKARIISKVLYSLTNSLRESFELILIDDGSVDASIDAMKSFLSTSSGFDYVLIANSESIYETACDNIGFYFSRGEYLLEIQSDMYINDPGFDLRMIEALNFSSIGTVSGRCGHSWFDLFGKKQKLWSLIRHPGFSKIYLLKTELTVVGLEGALIFKGISNTAVHDGDIFVSDTNNRGPWMIQRKVFFENDGFNSEKFFLGDDEHELNCRLKEKGYKAAYTPVKVHSVANEGSTRIPRSGLNLKIYDYLKNTKLGSIDLRQHLMNIKPSFPKKIL